VSSTGRQPERQQTGIVSDSAVFCYSHKKHQQQKNDIYAEPQMCWSLTGTVFQIKTGLTFLTHLYL